MAHEHNGHCCSDQHEHQHLEHIGHNLGAMCCHGHCHHPEHQGLNPEVLMEQFRKMNDLDPEEENLFGVKKNKKKRLQWLGNSLLKVEF